MAEQPERSLHIAAAFELNAAAALATVLGGFVIFSNRLLRVASPMALATTLSISGGVTLFLSLVLIFAFSVIEFGNAFEEEGKDFETLVGQAWLASTICFVVGVTIVYCTDFIVKKLTPGIEQDDVLPTTQPSAANTGNGRSTIHDNDTTMHSDDAVLDSPTASAHGEGGFVKMDEAAKEKLQRMGVLSGIAIALHNIPSGLATFAAGAEHPDVGLSMAIGIGLHNLAEGIAVAAPVYFATGNKWRGVMWCVVAALAQQLGALIAFAIIGTEVDDFWQALLYGVVTGMMAVITMKEIFPTAYMYANGRVYLVANGALVGMVIMAFSLVFFKYLGV